jgi:hypothetical protein
MASSFFSEGNEGECLSVLAIKVVESVQIYLVTIVSEVRTARAGHGMPSRFRTNTVHLTENRVGPLCNCIIEIE